MRIVTGTTALGPSESASVDLVVMDDFLYGEPRADVVPEPTTVLLVGTMMAGLGLAAWTRRRQS